jgi:NADH-quinone oxidoreductase subunit H
MTELIAQMFTLFVFPGFAFLFSCAMAFAWIDRRVIARLQGRVGPPWYQPFADWVKLMAKENILPAHANKWAATALPVVSLASVLTAGIYIPVGGLVSSAFEGDLIVVLFLLSIPALAYFLAGWVTVGVYSVIGGHRSLLQYFSYEVPFLMALSGPAILSGSWSVADIALRQSGTIWGVFEQPVGFLLAIIGLIGKLKRVPFDIPKAKSEIVAGPLTEFSGPRLALWNLSIQIKTVVGIFLLVNAFLGGSGVSGMLPPPLTFAVKSLLVLLILSLASVLYARLRIDQLANLGWRVLAPLALAQTAVTIWIGAR